jgi:hypothetical protein
MEQVLDINIANNGICLKNIAKGSNATGEQLATN